MQEKDLEEYKNRLSVYLKSRKDREAHFDKQNEDFFENQGDAMLGTLNKIKKSNLSLEQKQDIKDNFAKEGIAGYSSQVYKTQVGRKDIEDQKNEKDPARAMRQTLHKFRSGSSSEMSTDEDPDKPEDKWSEITHLRHPIEKRIEIMKKIDASIPRGKK